MKLPIGISDFAKLRKGNYTFIDKSLLIKDIVDDGAEVILFTRPRRFGKTLNMSMLYYYFALAQENAQAYFHDLKIWQQGDEYQQHQGKYPVIFITLKGIKFHCFEDAYAKLCSLISKLYSEYNFLLTKDCLTEEEKNRFNHLLKEQASVTEVQASLQALTEYLHRYYHTKPIVIIDEYDSPIHAAFNNHYYKEMIEFMQHFLGEALKDNLHLHKSIITGILRIAKESIFSGLNNLKVDTIFSTNYSQYFGFTEIEVINLLKQTEPPEKIISNTKKWYNGYLFGEQVIYNPWSVINFIDDKFNFQTYWVNTSDNELVDYLIKNSSAHSQQKLENLIQQQTLRVEVEEDSVFTDLTLRENALWNFLLHTGYLTLKNKTQDISGFYYGQFYIPNKEITLLYRTLVKRWFGTEHTPSTHRVTQYLVGGDIYNFKQLLGKFLTESFSYFDTQGKNKEQIYHVFVLGLVAHLSDYYFIRSNREAGDGRYDVVMIPKDKQRTGIIFEFKALNKDATQQQLQKAAQQALGQIQQNHYLAEFEQAGIEEVLQLGLAFAGKQFVVESIRV